jgi:hypothetical protein
MKTAALVSFTVFAFTACIDQADPADQGDPELSIDPQTAPNCTGTSTLGGTDHYVALGAAGTIASATTEDLSSYNPSTAPCFPNNWVVQIDFTLHRNLTPFVEYAGPSLSATTCAQSYVNGEVYGRIGTSWTLAASNQQSAGQWNPKLHSCKVPHVDFPEIVNSHFDEVTVIGEAVFNAGTLVNVTDGAVAH